MDNNYDFVVVGGGTAGCASAYIASKLGYKVLLIEKNSYLGGTMTGSLVVPVMKSGENLINTEFYNDLVKKMQEYKAQIAFQNNNGWFNPQILKIVLEEMLVSNGVDILFNSHVIAAASNKNLISNLFIASINKNFNSYSNVCKKNNNKILSAYNYSIHTDNIKISAQNYEELLSVCIGARYVIDATGNSEICQILNCEFLEDKNKNQPVNLRFIMSGVNVDEFGKWLTDTDSDREVSPVEVIDGITHLSTAYTWDSGRRWALAPLFKRAIDDGVLKELDSNYFQLFTIAQMPDSIAFNCPRLNVNDELFEAECVSKALIDARSSIFRLSNFCKKYLPGFKNAYISDIADMLGIRVSKRIKGRYVLTKDDIINSKKFKNPVAVSNYPIDVHTTDKKGVPLKQINEYQIPVECLMTSEFDNLFVAGRSLSADFEAQASARVQGTCFSMGEGLVKYIAKNLDSSRN